MKLIEYFLGVARKAAAIAADVAEARKRNEEIKKGIDDAKTKKERQDALNRAADRAGHP